MWRKAALLVPGDDIGGGAGGDFLCTRTRKDFVRDVAKADATAVRQEARVRRHMAANLRQRLVAAGCGDTIRFKIKGLLQIEAPAFPFGELQTGAEFRLNLIKRVSEQPWQERGSVCAF